MNPKIFPAILILLDVCAGLAYLIHGDARRAIYWFAAGVLTTSVTF